MLTLCYIELSAHSPPPVEPVFSKATRWVLCSCMQGDVRVDSNTVRPSWLDFPVQLSRWPSAVGGHPPPFFFSQLTTKILVTLVSRNAYKPRTHEQFELPFERSWHLQACLCRWWPTFICSMKDVKTMDFAEERGLLELWCGIRV